MAKTARSGIAKFRAQYVGADMVKKYNTHRETDYTGY
jgi:hypothetical protein